MIILYIIYYIVARIIVIVLINNDISEFLNWRGKNDEGKLREDIKLMF